MLGPPAKLALERTLGRFSERGTPFIGERGSFSEAFPTVKRAIARYTETDFGTDEHDRIHDLAAGPRAACGNPRCQRGGYDFELVLRSMVSSEATDEPIEMSCYGDEGSPKGRRPGRDCLMAIKGMLSVEYWDKDRSTDKSGTSS